MTLKSVVFFSQFKIVYFCVNELAVAPLNKGGKIIVLEKNRFQKMIE